MDTAASLSAGLTTTPARGWLVVLLSRLQGSSVVLISYSFGIFLPFIHTDLQLSPLEAGLLQSAPVQGLQHALETLQETPLRALRAYPQGWLVSAWSGLSRRCWKCSPSNFPAFARVRWRLSPH